MAVYHFKLPDIGEGIAEAEIVAWHVAAGDEVQEDAPLADMMTDKATVEITSPVSGRLTHLAGDVGEQLAIGAVLATFEVEGAVVEEPAATDAGNDAGSGDGAGDAARWAMAAPEPQAVSQADTRPIASASPPVAAAAANPSPTRIAASPAVRKRAKDLGIDLVEIAAARGERVRHADLDAYLSYHGVFRAAGSAREDEEVRVIGLRRRIAENMAASKRHIPHFSYVEEIDVTKLEQSRAELNAHRGDRTKLTMLPLLIVATSKAVRDFPMMNARYDDDAGVVTRSGALHLGIATQTDAGLMVPVIRDAQSRNIWQLATEVRRLSESARAGKASAAELSGSTLTITSLGPLGGIATTPVINRPEVAILGPNRVVERPVVRDGKIRIAKMMNLSISCDHRVVDGWDAASFVQRVKALLEAPSLLFSD